MDSLLGSVRYLPWNKTIGLFRSIVIWMLSFNVVTVKDQSVTLVHALMLAIQLLNTRMIAACLAWSLGLSLYRFNGSFAAVRFDWCGCNQLSPAKTQGAMTVMVGLSMRSKSWFASSAPMIRRPRHLGSPSEPSAGENLITQSLRSVVACSGSAQLWSGKRCNMQVGDGVHRQCVSDPLPLNAYVLCLRQRRRILKSRVHSAKTDKIGCHEQNRMDSPKGAEKVCRAFCCSSTNRIWVPATTSFFAWVGWRREM